MNLKKYLRCWINRKPQFCFFVEFHWKTFHEQGSKSRACSSSKWVKNDKSLKSRTLISRSPDLVHGQVDLLPPNGVVTSGIVVGRIFHSGYQLLRMKQLAISSSTDFIFRKKVFYFIFSNFRSKLFPWCRNKIPKKLFFYLKSFIFINDITVTFNRQLKYTLNWLFSVKLKLYFW